MSPTPVTIREATEPERSIAYDSWWKQMANLRPPHTPMGLWRRGCQERVVQVLELSRVLVAIPKGKADDVVGLVCFGPALLHFVYVKFHVRTWGVARRLLAEAAGTDPAIRFTTMPRRRFEGLVQPQWSFDPFAGTGLHFGTGPFQETP